MYNDSIFLVAELNSHKVAYLLLQFPIWTASEGLPAGVGYSSWKGY